MVPMLVALVACLEHADAQTRARISTKDDLSDPLMAQEGAVNASSGKCRGRQQLEQGKGGIQHVLEQRHYKFGGSRNPVCVGTREIHVQGKGNPVCIDAVTIIFS